MKTEIRIEVLEFALYVEKSVGDLLVLYLNIEVEKKKSLTNKSGGLTFKNKLDLLFDIEILDQKEYQAVLLLMEFRNQFMHNYECDTFCDAFEFLGPDKKNKLLKYLNNSTELSDEEKGKLAFRKLYKETLEIIVSKIRLKKTAVHDVAELFNNELQKSINLIDKYFDLCEFIIQIAESEQTDNPEVLRFQTTLLEKLDEYVEKDFKSEPIIAAESNLYEERKLKMIRKVMEGYRK